MVINQIFAPPDLYGCAGITLVTSEPRTTRVSADIPNFQNEKIRVICENLRLVFARIPRRTRFLPRCSHRTTPVLQFWAATLT